MDFCGHATLASSFVRFNQFDTGKTIHFHVKDLGIFVVVNQDADGKIRMNFPVRRAEPVAEYPEALRQALSKPFKQVYLNAQGYIVEYESVQDVLDETPDFELLKQLNGKRTVITAQNYLFTSSRSLHKIPNTIVFHVILHRVMESMKIR